MEKNIYQEQKSVSPQEIEKLHILMIYGRWIAVGLAWLLIMPWALWEMRETIELCIEYCTWSGVRLGLEFHPLPSLGISFCIGFAISVLVWQSTNILQGGLSDKQKYYLRKQVIKIRYQREKNMFYKWINQLMMK